MTATRSVAREAGANAVTGPLPVPRRAAQRRWRPGLVALAVCLVATGGLSAAYAVTTVGTTHEYLAVARPVAVGVVVTAQDLTRVRITTDPALRPIPASDTGRVVGKHAKVALVPGSLLSSAQLTSDPLPGPGQQLVGLGLSQDRLPGRHLTAGAAVLLVVTAAQSSLAQPDSDPAPATPQTVSATVVGIQPAAKAGSVLVDVSVAAADGPVVAQLAAADRISIVLAGG